jgi:prepilin-type N-terminal cleavage/methylation domain-containing protein
VGETLDMLSIRKRPAGFTIIEVLIVLAIVAFILLLIFYVIPRARRESVNLQRKHAVDLTAASIEEYRSSHGNIPYTQATWDSFSSQYLQKVTDQFTLDFRVADTGHDFVPPLDTIAIQLGHYCNVYGDGDDISDPIAGVAHDTAQVKYVIWTILSTSSAKKLYCIDNRGK